MRLSLFPVVVVAALVAGGCAPGRSGDIACNDDRDCVREDVCEEGRCIAVRIVERDGDAGHAPRTDGGADEGDDGGASPDDSGASLDDGGAQVDDGGAFLDDGGALVDDGGTSPDDGGGQVDDGGASLDDGGVSPDDGGAPLDGGPVLDGGGLLDADAGQVDDDAGPNGDAGAQPCSTVGAIDDDFADGIVAPVWGYTYVDATVTMTETDGHVVIDVPGGTGVRYAGYVTGTRWLLDESWLELTVLGRVTASGETYFGLGAIDDAELSIRATGSSLAVRERLPSGAYQNLCSTTYSATQHKVWRYRESGDTLFFEAGPGDGSFAALCTRPAAGFEGPLEVGFGAGTYGTVAAAQQAVFDVVAGGGPADICPAARFGQDLRGGAIDDGPYVALQYDDCSAEVDATGFVAACTGGGAAWLDSAVAVDLREGSIAVEIAARMGGAVLFFKAMQDGDEELKVEIQDDGDTLRFFRAVGETEVDLASFEHEAAVTGWLRIRPAGTDVFFETSTNGTDWDVQATDTSGLVDLSRARVQVGLWAETAPSTPSTTTIGRIVAGP